MRLRRLCLIMIFFLSLIAISQYGGAISYGILYGTILLPVVSWVYLIYVYFHFRVHQEIQTRNMIAGQPVDYSFILKNEGHTVFTGIRVKIHADFSFVEEVPDQQEFRLYPGEKKDFMSRLTCKYRGEYKVGVSKLILTDFLGLFRLAYRMPSEIEALVKPRIIRLDSIAGIPVLEEYLHSQNAFEKNEQDLTVRDYLQGDSLKKIHWKATAKSNVLKVRNEIGTLKQKMLLLADFGRHTKREAVYLPLENKILEITIAILYYFALQKIPIELLWQGAGLEKRSVSQMSHFSETYEELAAFYFRRDSYFIHFCQEAVLVGLPAEGSLLFMVTQEIDEALFTIVSNLVTGGKTAILYVVTNDDISQYERQSTVRMKITRVTPEEEIEGIL